MQNTKQVLDWDNKDIFKRKREFYLDEDLVDKIDSIEYGAQVNKIEEIEVNWVPVEPDESKTVKLKIPRVINAVTSDSESDALSAAMGKYLYTLISEWWGWGWGWEYTAWKWIRIIWNEISNTLPWAVVSATAPANPSKWTSWYDTTNDVLKVYNWSSWVEVWNWKQAFFKTQAEYNALPSSKTTDGNLYIIVDNHAQIYTWEELENMWSENALQILNEHPKDYAEYYESTGNLTKYDYYEWFNDEHWPLNPLPEWKYVLRYNWQYNNCSIAIYVSNLTESEISSVWFPSGYHFDDWWELRCRGSSM